MTSFEKILVTGGGGFLGSEIIKQIHNRWPHMQIHSLARSYYPHLEAFGVKQFQCDLSDLKSLQDAANGVQCIIHTAAKAGVWGKEEDYEKINVLGTRNVLDICRTLNIKYLIYTSSPSVTFSGLDQEGEDESKPYPRQFLNAYSRTKAIAEQMVLTANCQSLNTVALRPHLIWGPGDPHLVKRIKERALKGKLKLIRSAKACLVDSTYISNAAHAHILALEKFQVADTSISGKAYFISNGEPLAINDLIRRIAQASGAPTPKREVSHRLAFLLGTLFELVYKALGIKTEPLLTRFVAKQLSTHHWFDLSAAKRDLGYRPLVGIKEGLQALEPVN